MLQTTTNYTDGEVLSIKLISGEEILGRFKSQDIATLKLDRPLMLGMTAQGMALAPFMATIDQEAAISFPKDKIIVTVPTLKEIADQYIYQTTGIQPVSAGSLIR